MLSVKIAKAFLSVQHLECQSPSSQDLAASHFLPYHNHDSQGNSQNLYISFQLVHNSTMRFSAQMITITIEAEQYTQIYKEDVSLAVDAKETLKTGNFPRF